MDRTFKKRPKVLKKLADFRKCAIGVRNFEADLVVKRLAFFYNDNRCFARGGHVPVFGVCDEGNAAFVRVLGRSHSQYVNALRYVSQR
jgi:hypothetical protein